jgi:alpha-amylase
VESLKKFCQISILIFLLVACAPGQESATETSGPGATVLSPTPAVLPLQETVLPTALLPPSPTPTVTLIPYTTPDWSRDAVIYEIFVRSFADSDGDGTGDLKGITERLDYLESLGVTAIWLMPIYPSPSAHGYDVKDYFDVNPDYGDLRDLRELVQTAHDREMKVILDFVPSHLSSEHPYFIDAYGNPDSIYNDWFVWENEAHTLYAGYASNKEMPRFNHYNPEVAHYLVQAALFWMDLDGDGDFSNGVDGFRVDNATFPPQEFFQFLRQEVKAANPDALLLGETWVQRPRDLSIYFLDQFDALFDFPLYEAFQGNKDFNGDGVFAGKQPPVLLSVLMEQAESIYPQEAMTVKFLSNHDTNRIATEVSGNAARMRLAPALLSALPGPIMVYYGEEIGMLGQKGGAPHWDNYRREPMDWYTAEAGAGQPIWFLPDDRWNKPNDGISVEEQEDDPDSLLNIYRKYLRIRRETPTLRIGRFDLIEMEVSGIGPWGFTRSLDGETILALYNFASEEREITVAYPFASMDTLVDLLTGQPHPGTGNGDELNILLPPESAFLLTVP